MATYSIIAAPQARGHDVNVNIVDALGMQSSQGQVQDPPLQRAAGATAGAAVVQAVGSAAQTGIAHLSAGIQEVASTIQEDHDFVKAVALCVSLALMVSSLLAVINVFNAILDPIQYLFAFYNLCFALIIFVIEGKQTWFEKCGNLRVQLFSAAAFLGWQGGRAVFYFFVGSINLFLLPATLLWKIIYLAMGGALCFVGVLMLLGRLGLFGRPAIDRGAVTSEFSSSESES
eukprot:TRINITY_DN61033_c0_g1_i1.p1 TRINITY_DN61033_c0_g1~~TRINITY_DN61033_c0_g1_i1.p1  ORF type:complete len:247 (+),score=44.45 TRINITY_DN61033_c0_g1_i1:49-741(+)